MKDFEKFKQETKKKERKPYLTVLKIQALYTTLLFLGIAIFGKNVNCLITYGTILIIIELIHCIIVWRKEWEPKKNKTKASIL